MFKIDFSIFSDESINSSALIRSLWNLVNEVGSMKAGSRKFLKAHQKRITQTHPHQKM